MQKTLTYYDNQSRQIYNIINPPAKYIYFQFPIESNVITILKVHDKSTWERERERKNRRLSIIRQIGNIMDKASNKRGKEQKKKRKRKRKRNNTRMQKCSVIAVDLSSNRINCDPRRGWMEHRCNDPWRGKATLHREWEIRRKIERGSSFVFQLSAVKDIDDSINEHRSRRRLMDVTGRGKKQRRLLFV